MSICIAVVLFYSLLVLLDDAFELRVDVAASRTSRFLIREKSKCSAGTLQDCDFQSTDCFDYHHTANSTA